MISVLLNIGYNNMVSAERVVAIINPASVPAKRLRDEAKQSGLLIDLSCGHRVRSMIVSSSRHVILSAIEVRTLAGRYHEACLEFHNRVGRPVMDELSEPGQGPEPDGREAGASDEESPRRGRKAKAKAPAERPGDSEVEAEAQDDDEDDDLDQADYVGPDAAALEDG
jgi:regulator of extracellular matrix RemA (YlzA/DUF370 family)